MGEIIWGIPVIIILLVLLVSGVFSGRWSQPADMKFADIVVAAFFSTLGLVVMWFIGLLLWLAEVVPRNFGWRTIFFGSAIVWFAGFITNIIGTMLGLEFHKDPR